MKEIFSFPIKPTKTKYYLSHALSVRGDQLIDVTGEVEQHFCQIMLDHKVSDFGASVLCQIDDGKIKVLQEEIRMPPQPKESILDEAGRLISQDRRAEYGPVTESFDCIAELWTTALKRLGLLRESAELSPEAAALLMILFKVSRELHAEKRDNRVDMCGYAALLDQIIEERKTKIEDQTTLNGGCI